MDGNYDKVMKLPVFDGTQDGYQMWWMRYRAYAGVQRFLPALSATFQPQLPATEGTVLDISTDDGKKHALNKKMNAVAVATLTMAFKNESEMSLVYKSITADWPGGLAYKIVEGLDLSLIHI